MKGQILITASIAVAFMILGQRPAVAQQPASDFILRNGKIITVDDRFTIAEAVAVRGERIVGVGTNEDIDALAGPDTTVIDLKGRSVIPGFIDNHGHIMEEGPIWQLELRLDGIDTRAEALQMMRDHAIALGPGEWVFTLGGWATDQFTDDQSDFTRDELDAVSPDNPVLLQVTREHTYLNSLAIDAAELDGSNAPWIVRNEDGRPTGVIEAEGIRSVSDVRPPPPPEIFEASSMAMIKDMNRVGLTTVGGPCPADYIDRFRVWGDEGRLYLRFFCFVRAGLSNTTDQVDELLPQITTLKPFQWGNWVDQTAYGETVYRPLHDSMLAPTTNPSESDLYQWRRIATEVARAGLPLHVHATIENTITSFLDQIELVNREFPIRNLRWALAHVDQVNASHLQRMKNLGMYLAVHTRPTVMGGMYKRAHGDRALDMPPLSLIQQSGIIWGLGSDTFEVNQYRPFTTLWWAVTGKMVGGTTVLRQTISREDALIAHTRQNAFLVFQENNLGSIQPGKFADLVVLDRDYLTIPDDEIKDIQPVMTMVGGRIAFDESN
ncbi:MAG: putative amidohydrolase YtcJ [Gammaproteobacteria bacterium]|jgi:predicted amidohydrolase YtcJ